MVRTEVQQPDWRLLQLRDRRSARRDADGRAGLPVVLGQRLRGPLSDPGWPGTDRVGPRRVRTGGQFRPGLRVRFHVEDHLPGSRSRVLRIIARERFLAPWAPGQADHRTGQGEPAPARHLLRDEAGVLELMDRHREILAPKFALVDSILRDGLTGIASWTLPSGGYFMTLDVPDGCTTEVVRLAAEAGVALTPAGATHPYGRDPRDRTIRLAPTFPSLADLEQAMRGLVTCVRLAAASRPSDSPAA